MSGTESGTPKQHQPACALCGGRFAKPQESRGSGNKLCEDCLDGEL